ncbi:DUF1963 domain-containing protein [Acidovorax sp. ACV01]|uniref:DUF1963 domain-containing protein n=1 Tax=Acidovorax sp. ACV01 TaxID=2769311 RepID=UPI00177BBEFE|nr:DUF1963 domain-containing protein [Acidovorax sp. ACV01]MBD9391478.1 DUF1963 domain-containing protein [Acidovorax sp. ACV01]
MNRPSTSPASDVFQIGITSFAFAADANVEFVDGGMRFDLKAVPMPFDAAHHEGVFEVAAGKIAPRFFSATFHFDDRSKEPHRVFAYPAEKPRVDFGLFSDGLKHGLRFFGQVDLAPDRLALSGVLRQDYEGDAQGVALRLVLHFPRGEVRLRPRNFESIEAGLAVPPKQVRHLHWFQEWRDTPKVDTFPSEIFRWTELEWLSMQYASQDHARFTTLPDEIGTLQKLTRLRLTNTSVLHLPDAIAQLRGLRQLSFTGGALKSISAQVAQLGQLEELDLSYNRLTSLPEGIGHLPALKTLDLRGNPFESLPASIGRIENLRIDPRHRALYRDTRYRPEIDVAMDGEVFLARSSPTHLALLQAALTRHGFLQHEPALRRHARQALRWRTTTPDEPPVLGGTRFGGAPDLPPSVDYPMTNGRHWHFYAQLDLEAVAGLQSWLPRTGWLYFFAEGQDGSDRTLVMYDTSPRASLQPYEWGHDARFVDGDNVPEAYAAYRATVDATVSVPCLYGASHRYTGDDASLMEVWDDDQCEAYTALETELAGSDDSQHGVHLQNAFVFTQQQSPEEQAMDTQGGKLEEWVNLLTLYSDRHPGFSFWDAGTLTFTIHRKDLALRDFSRVRTSLESS